MLRIACLYFPEWPIQRLIHENPELRYQKIVLYQSHALHGKRVVAASPLAVQHGVKPGMPLTEAKSLLQQDSVGNATRDSAASKYFDGTCDSRPTAHGLYLFPYESRLDRNALETLARKLESFSPLIGLDDQMPSTSLLLNLTGLDKLFGTEAHLLGELAAYLREEGYLVCIAAAPTIGAAWALAHYGKSSCSAFPGAGPPGEPPAIESRFLMLRDFDWQVLDELPPEALRIETTTCETLTELGIKTIGMLRIIPAASLTIRFGDLLNRRLRQMCGEQAESFMAVHRATTYRADCVLDHPLQDQASLLLAIENLLRRLCGQLELARQGAMSWRICLRRGTTPPIHLLVNLFAASARTDQVLALLHMQLEQKGRGSILGAAVDEILVSAENCVRLCEQQGELFPELPHKNCKAFGDLVNRLAIRLGENQVVAVTSLSSLLPERSVGYHPLIGPRAKPPRRSGSATSPLPFQRPIRLLKKLRELIPHENHGRIPGSLSHRARPTELPQAFILDGKVLTIGRSWGPERIETDWWRGHLIRRDYWRIETVDESQYWIFRELRSRKWFLQGGF